jgi:prepilin-type N-terminal cleavage/methylation domain-containing protein
MRRGLTLLELMIVLAILVSMAAVSWPLLRKSFAKARLTHAARLVRSELAKARLAAIESGQPQIFRFQPGTGIFEVKPQMPDMPEEGPTYGNSITQAMQSNQPDSLSEADPLNEQTWQQALPSGVLFLAQQAAATQDESNLPGQDLASQREAESWSPPVVFYPNGRTTNARVRLTDGRDFSIDVSLRGLTGLATVGKVEPMPVETRTPGEQEAEAPQEAEP